jgi:hypothetical protein
MCISFRLFSFIYEVRIGRVVQNDVVADGWARLFNIVKRVKFVTSQDFAQEFEHFLAIRGEVIENAKMARTTD